MDYIKIIPAITGIVQIVKMAGVPSKYCPIIAVILGILFVLPSNLSTDGAILGILLGLSSVGLYELPKMTYAKKVRQESIDNT